MPRDRFFVAGVHAVGDRVALMPDDARKIVTVLRRQTGDRVDIVDAGEFTFAARLVVDAKLVHAVIESTLAGVQSESSARIVIAQAIPKGQKMDFIVEKATELGVAAIVPLRSARVVGERTGDHKPQRWQRIAKSAAQQSGRGRVPRIEAESDWDALLATFRDFELVYIAWEHAQLGGLRDRFEGRVREAASILIVIGPEGGFSADEVARARAAGAVEISLGTRILRTETAALVVLSALLYARGEL